MKPISLLAERGRRARLLAFVTLAVASVSAGSAEAHPTINVAYDPAISFSAADKTAIQNALKFYTTNMTSDFTMTLAVGAQASGGGAAQFLESAATYNSYYGALVANSSGGATDVSAIASLGGGAHVSNPVTGSGQVDMTTTLASLLGLAPQASVPFSGCGGVSANACIIVSLATLNVGGTPLAALNGIVQHEFDEVLGTASGLSTGFVPNDPDTADLYRYAAPGVRSFALNTSTGVPCTGSPTAYFSVDGGATNLQSFNNCNNGGDYGDWIGIDGKRVQDAFGPDTQASSLDLAAPEVQLLDAVGYSFSLAAPEPEPETWALAILGLAFAGSAFRSRRREIAAD